MTIANKIIDERRYLAPTRVPYSLVSVLIALTLCVVIYCGFITNQLPDFSAYTTTLLVLLSLVISL